VERIEVKDTIWLNDGQAYTVCSKIAYRNNSYLFLISKNDAKSIKFCRETKNLSLVEIDEKILIQELLPLFLQSSINAFTREDLDLIKDSI